MNKYFYKLIKAFTADPKNKDDLSFSKFKRWILWNPEYGYIVYNNVRNYKETIAEIKKCIKDVDINAMIKSMEELKNE